jgi:hypothetical protein
MARLIVLISLFSNRVVLKRGASPTLMLAATCFALLSLLGDLPRFSKVHGDKKDDLRDLRS